MFKHLNYNEYFPASGTLLGILRHHDIIPHDHDLDFVVKDMDIFNIIVQNRHLFPDDIRGKVSSRVKTNFQPTDFMLL